MNDSVCPECGSERKDFTRVCPACGAPPVDNQQGPVRAANVRTADLEPYVALRYIARLFKVLAAEMTFAPPKPETDLFKGVALLRNLIEHMIRPLA